MAIRHIYVINTFKVWTILQRLGLVKGNRINLLHAFIFLRRYESHELASAICTTEKMNEYQCCDSPCLLYKM